MAAVNAGTARIIVPGGQGLADGGRAGASAARATAGGVDTLLNVENVNLIEGTPRDLANELAIKLRTGSF
ncbi:hypothetical protein IN07_03345 [Modestobacter caceresii]|uniref:Uncharacterized protein n=1 Tax=Modestobacter caceresii TaxID=1522368 RepID=A0A098YCV2_9ACTN|nr:hypothetical protein [Modestobacter caceresii]KGH48250.1 hypothetical protein IN07_03345 [Modestobacter caceresii]